jgi:hypothetical protein
MIRCESYRLLLGLNDVAKMHHHPDYVVYALKGGKMSLTAEGKTQEMDVKEGQVMFLDA